MRRHPHRQQRDALQSSNQMKKRQLADDPSPSIGKLVARMAVRKALRTVPEIRFRTAYVLGFKLPEQRDKQFFETALKNELSCHSTNEELRHFGPDFFYFLGRADRSKNRRRAADEASQLLEELDENQRMIGVSTPENPMTPQFKEIAEAIIEAPIESRFIKAALRIAHDIHICDKTAERLLSYTLSELTLAFRGNRPLNTALRFLEGLRGASTLAHQEQNGSADVRDLSQSHGYGKAKVWGLELAQDFHDLKAGKIQWSDVDRGILLRGDTGTGKTTFAKSLAKSCGAVLVECSLTKSQALGHLGDMLRGLNNAFKDARSKAPSILFFDEFDSIGNRETLSRHAPEYATQVINGLLDLMDGLESREGEDFVEHFDALNEARAQKGLPALPKPSIRAMRTEIRNLAPYHVDAGRNGEAFAAKKYAYIQGKNNPEWPLQVVEMDEWKVSLQTLLKGIGSWEKLGLSTREDLKKDLGRMQLSAAIDVRTKCILAMQLAPTATTDLAISTLKMAMSDKNDFAKAAGCETPWDMAGRIQTVRVDNGPAYTAGAFSTAAIDTGIAVDYTVAGAPYLRGSIERVFSTIHTKLISGFDGRTFSNVVEKGDYDAGARASLTIEELARALVRWVVDVYHNTPHEGLGGQPTRSRCTVP